MDPCSSISSTTLDSYAVDIGENSSISWLSDKEWEFYQEGYENENEDMPPLTSEALDQFEGSKNYEKESYMLPIYLNQLSDQSTWNKEAENLMLHTQLFQKAMAKVIDYRQVNLKETLQNDPEWMILWENLDISEKASFVIRKRKDNLKEHLNKNYPEWKEFWNQWVYKDYHDKISTN